MTPPRHLAPTFLAVCVFGIGSPVLDAQAPAYDQQVRDFDQAFRSKDPERRAAAIQTFANSGEPAAIKVLLERAGKASQKLGKLRERFESVGRRLHEEQAKITNVRLTQSQADQAQKAIKPLKSEHEELDGEIAGEERVRAALLAGVGGVVKSAPEDRRGRCIDALTGAFTDTSRPEERLEILAAMGEVSDPAVGSVLIGALRLSDRPDLRVAALLAMEKQPAEAMIPAVHDAFRDEETPVRSAALAFLRTFGGKESIGPLIGLLGKEEGRTLDEVIATLRALTKVNYHDNATLWRAWWGKNEAVFEGRGKSAGVAGAAVAAGDGPAPQEGGQGTYFYGIQSRAKHIIYVLDISRSMRWTLGETYREGRGPLPPDAPPGKSKFDSAMKELLQSVMALTKDGTFDIVVYSIETAVWKKGMQKATPENKAAARKWAEELSPDGATNIFDAIEQAFAIAGRGSFDKHYGLAADTIFFLSDGEANRGRVVEGEAMLREIRKMNELRRLQIHSVALGMSCDLPFMRAIAEQNGGQFAHVKP